LSIKHNLTTNTKHQANGSSKLTINLKTTTNLKEITSLRVKRENKK
jgi:hypothetical protein